MFVASFSLGAAEYTFDEFVELVNQPLEEKGETEDEKRHWSHPRRWKVVLWNLSIKNYMTDKLSLFVEFEFGGSREECKVHVRREQSLLTVRVALTVFSFIRDLPLPMLPL